MKKKTLEAPVQKNQELFLMIDDIGKEGEGIGHVDGFAVMVPGLLPKETARVKIVKVKNNYAYGILLELIDPSLERTAPACPLNGKCGGCQFGHMKYQAQLSYKRNIVKQDLLRIGHFTDEEIETVMAKETLGMEDPAHYRNKAQFPIRCVNGRTEAGFFAPRSHRLLPVYDCYIQSERANELIAKIVEKARALSLTPYDEESGKGILRHVLIRTGKEETSVTFVINKDTLPHEKEWILFMREEKVTSFSIDINKARNNIILGYQTKTLFGSSMIRDTIQDLTFEISPTAFYQVNAKQMQVLYEKALEFADLKGTETVFDAYCGIGTISLFLARKAKQVYGVELIEEAVKNAENNAKLNHIENAVFYAGKAEEIIPLCFQQDKIKADVIVVDPPRAGCDEVLLKTMAEMDPEKIVYISCDPATLSRDLDILCHQNENHYQLAKVQTVDLFPMTGHVETVVLLSRK